MDTEKKTTLPKSAGYWTHRVSKAYHVKINKRVNPMGLTGAQAIVLNLVAQYSPNSVGELAGKLGHSVPAIVRQIEALECAGLIERQQDPDDERVRRLRLTDKGKTLQPEVLAALQSVHETAMKDVGPEQERVLFDLLQKVLDNLENS